MARSTSSKRGGRKSVPKKNAKSTAKAKTTPKKKSKPATSREKSRESVKRTKRPASRPRKISREEIDRRLAIARAAASRERINRRGEQPRLNEALEVAQDIARRAGAPSLLRAAYPPLVAVSQWAAPWVIVGRFQWKPGITYEQLYGILDAWDRSSSLNRRIDRDRMSRLKLIYIDGRTDRREEFTLSETGPWGGVLARAMGECDPSDTETVRQGGHVGSLAARYGGANADGAAPSSIESLFVWLSSDKQKNINANVKRGIFR